MSYGRGRKRTYGRRGNGGRGNGHRGNGRFPHFPKEGPRARDRREKLRETGVHVLPDGEVTYESPPVRYATPRRGARRRLFPQDEMEARRQDAVQRHPRFQAERQRRFAAYGRDMERRGGLRGIIAPEHHAQFDEALGMYEDMLIQEFHDAAMYALEA